MRKILTTLCVLFLASSAYAADVVCGCEEPNTCSDVLIRMVPANPGVYMTIEYAFGEKNLEGFANIIRDEKNDRVIYKLDNFVLIEKNNIYTLPLKPQTCS